MPKGVPKAGKRAPGGGAKPKPPGGEQTRVRAFRLTDAQYEAVRGFVARLKAESASP